MTALGELVKISHYMPLKSLQDVNQRVGDWLASGGNEDDPYIYQQLRFAQRFVPKKEEGED